MNITQITELLRRRNELLRNVFVLRRELKSINMKLQNYGWRKIDKLRKQGEVK